MMTVYAGDELTAEEYASAAQEALAELSAGSDKSVLADLVSQAQKLDISTSDDTSVTQLQAVIASAAQVCADENASQSMVDKSIQLLQAAANALYEKQMQIPYTMVFMRSAALSSMPPQTRFPWEMRHW